MGSDYSMIQVARFEEINGVKVPVAEDGHYLDHETVVGQKARELTSPYGCLHFAIGTGSDDDDDDDDGEGGDFTVYFDYATLPDGRIILDAVADSDSGGFIQGFDYQVVTPDEAVATAWNMTDAAIDAVSAVNLLTHDREGWNQDEYYFVRSVAKLVGVEPYRDMEYKDLRVGEVPNFG